MRTQSLFFLSKFEDIQNTISILENLFCYVLAEHLETERRDCFLCNQPHVKGGFVLSPLMTFHVYEYKMFLFVFVLSDVTTNILQVRVNWFSELLQTLVCFRLEVLQYVLKVMFLAKIKLESETGQMKD